MCERAKEEGKKEKAGTDRRRKLGNLVGEEMRRKREIRLLSMRDLHAPKQGKL